MSGSARIARAAHGFCTLHRRMVHLLRADHTRRRRARRASSGILEPDQFRPRAGRIVGGAVGRGGCRCHRRVARGLQTAGDREHGARTHDALHPAVRGDADSERQSPMASTDHRRRFRIAICWACSTRCSWSCSASCCTPCRRRNRRNIVSGSDGSASSWSPSWPALVLDLMVLVAMVARIGDLGFTPNRAATLGLNLVLLVNLAAAHCGCRPGSSDGRGHIASAGTVAHHLSFRSLRYGRPRSSWCCRRCSGSPELKRCSKRRHHCRHGRDD